MGGSVPAEVGEAQPWYSAAAAVVAAAEDVLLAAASCFAGAAVDFEPPPAQHDAVRIEPKYYSTRTPARPPDEGITPTSISLLGTLQRYTKANVHEKTQNPSSH